MSLKLLTQLSHFITMMFGIALGMALCLLYQFKISIFIDNLSPLIIVIIILSGCLRFYTIILWKKGNYSFKNFNEQLQ